MKIKLLFLWMTLLSMTCIAQTEYSQTELEKMFNKHISDYTNSVVVTANIIFFLSNGGYPKTQFRSDQLIYENLAQIPISLHTTNLISFYRIPYDQTFSFHLYDKAGKEVKKTKFGMTMSQPVSPKTYGRWPFNNVGHLLYVVVKNNVDCHGLFKPDDVFVITNKGDYDLSISMRICVPMTNNVVDTNALTDWHLPVKTYEAIESPALHVKVIKE